MEKTSKNKWQVRLAALSIFILGLIAGALALNLYHTRFSPSVERPWGGRPPFTRLAELTQQLDLTAEQSAEVEKILSEARTRLMEIRKESEPKFSEIRRQTEERLQQTLSTEQWQKFQQIKTEMRGRRGERGRGRRRPDADR